MGLADNFILELDTTGPEIEINAPTYMVNNDDNYMEIFINANEQLLEDQLVYIVDGAGNTHNYIFEHRGDQLYGLVNFVNISLGIATIYARLRDEVGNLSDTASKAVNVIRSAKIRISSHEEEKDVELTSAIRNIVFTVEERDIYVAEKRRGVVLSDRSRKVEVTVE